MKVDILLACFNGEKYLAELLNSILSQTYADFQIIARDDISTDKTLSILLEFQKQYPQKIQIIPAKERLGITKNFATLLSQSFADYLFFADQDDVWDTEKIADFVARFEREEQNKPLLLFSDLDVVDQDLQPLYPSFWKRMGINPRKDTQLNYLLVNNCVTGCAMAINKPLKELVFPIPNQAIVHDGWIALVASACGSIIAIEKTTIKYRQHEKNVVGMKNLHFLAKWEKLKNYLFSSFNEHECLSLVLQAKTLLDQFALHMTEEKRKTLLIFIKGKDLSWGARKWHFLKERFFRRSFLNNLFRFCLNRPF